MATFVISNLNTKNFIFEGISFERLAYNIDIEKQWRDQRDATFKAVADDNLDVKPIISNNGLVGVVDDICLLLSIALSSYVYCSLDTNNETLYLGGILHIRDVRGRLMVRHSKIESFLDTAARTLRKPHWAEKTGFVPSVYFLRGANCSVFDDDAFMLCWIALEILANANANELGISQVLPKTEFNKSVKPAVLEALNGIDKGSLPAKQKTLIKDKIPELNRTSIRNKVYELRDTYKWDFITNKLFGECNKLRNYYMHLGSYAGFNEHKLNDLSSRFRDSIQLALIDLLGCSSYVPDLENKKMRIKGS